jgi:hypothetical protein
LKKILLRTLRRALRNWVRRYGDAHHGRSACGQIASGSAVQEGDMAWYVLLFNCIGQSDREYFPFRPHDRNKLKYEV